MRATGVSPPENSERGKAGGRDSFHKKTNRKPNPSAQKCALKIWHWHGGETFDGLDCLFPELCFTSSFGVGEGTVSRCKFIVPSPSSPANDPYDLPFFPV